MMTRLHLFLLTRLITLATLGSRAAVGAYRGCDNLRGWALERAVRANLKDLNRRASERGIL